MTWLQAIVLGIVQGLTEFLPISSSAHLVLVPWLMGWTFEADAAFVFNILVQLGTLVSVILYFRRDLLAIARAMWEGALRRQPLNEPASRLGWMILLASVPAGLAGILLKDLVEQAFASPLAVCVFLLINAGLMIGAERLARPERNLEAVNASDALAIGAAQILALFPGISRSGSTISAGIVRRLLRPEAARFSFLMSIPVMVGAGMIATLDLVRSPSAVQQIGPILAGFTSAAIVGYLAIRWLLGFLARNSLKPFAIYCAALGLAGILLFVVRG
jgi:undecaprenyl-diphosphatase